MSSPSAPDCGADCTSTVISNPIRTLPIPTPAPLPITGATPAHAALYSAALLTLAGSALLLHAHRRRRRSR